jgi:hypothetical protein
MNWTDFLSAGALIVVALIEAFAAKERKCAKDDRERSEQRSKLRSRESLLAMKLADANIELGLATALAVELQHTNGEIKAAQEKAREAQQEYQDFMRELTASQVTNI